MPRFNYSPREIKRAGKERVHPRFRHRQMTPFEWGLLLTLSVLWGGSFFFGGVAVKQLPPLTIVVLRVALTASALLAVLRIMGVKLSTDRAPTVISPPWSSASFS